MLNIEDSLAWKRGNIEAYSLWITERDKLLKRLYALSVSLEKQNDTISVLKGSCTTERQKERLEDAERMKKSILERQKHLQERYDFVCEQIRKFQ